MQLHEIPAGTVLPTPLALRVLRLIRSVDIYREVQRRRSTQVWRNDPLDWEKNQHHGYAANGDDPPLWGKKEQGERERKVAAGKAVKGKRREE